MWKRLVLVGVLMLSACTTGEKAATLREGMTRSEVEAVLGKPDGFQRAGEYVGYQYTNRLISGWSWDRADYVTIFKNGRLIQWGPGQVRQNEPASALVIVPVL